MRRGTMAVINQSRNSFIERRKSSVAASGFSSGRGSLAGSYGFERQIFNDYFIIFWGHFFFQEGHDGHIGYWQRQKVKVKGG